MSTQLLLVSEAPTLPGQAPTAARAWAGTIAPDWVAARQLYTALDGSSVLELMALPDVAKLALLDGWWQHCLQATRPYLQGDMCRQVLRFVEAPKDCTTPLPRTRYIQLRHVEVRPPVHEAYLAWREQTIFQVVREASEVETFLAYHSLISNEPGVMFVSGFSGSLAAYSAVFGSPAYQDIVRQAGNRFITGGERGLYTKLYQDISQPEPQP